MRIYLVVIDESEEAQKALRFASRRVSDRGDAVHILAIVEKQNFTAFGAVQATIEEEAHDRAEAIASSAAGNLFSESGRMPKITVRTGEGHEVVRDYLVEHPEVVALVLGAAAHGSPGPLVQHFASHTASLSCPLYIVPGRFSVEEIDRLAT